MEADAELTDNVDFLFVLFVLCQILFELERAAVCNYTEVLFHFLLVHSDTVIGYGYCSCILVSSYVYAEIISAHSDIFVRK